MSQRRYNIVVASELGVLKFVTGLIYQKGTDFVDYKLFFYREVLMVTPRQCNDIPYLQCNNIPYFLVGTSFSQN